MTQEELAARRKWSLNQKIDHSIGTVESFINKTGKVPYVSFSGGKDSTVLLDLVRRFVDPGIKGVFCNTGNEYPEIIQFVRHTPNVVVIRPNITVSATLDKYGFPLISKEQARSIHQARTTKSEKLRNLRLYGTDPSKGFVSGKISEKWKKLIYAPFSVSEMCCDILKKKPFKKYERETGEVPIIGTMTDESRLRSRQYIRRGGCNSFKEGKIASYPLSIWTEDDIWAYIHKFNVPYCELYDKGAHRTGCMFCGFGAHMENPDDSRFSMLYRLHPKAYQMFMNYTNSGVTYREALRFIGVRLPDECQQLTLPLFDEQVE